MKGECFVILSLATRLVACQTNPISGRKQLVLVSEEQAQRASTQFYAQTVWEAKQKGSLDNNPALAQRVKRITDRLIAQAGIMSPASRNWQWSVAVINEPTLNACLRPAPDMIRTPQ